MISKNSRSEPVQIDWQQIETVFLDMDGTLLDLHFDNHFWTQFVPARFGEKHSITQQQAFDRIFPHMLSIRGSLEWYDVHYWSNYLDMDVLSMKHDAADRIQPRPGAIEFLEALRQAGKNLVLATNAHQDTLDVKFRRSGIGAHFDHVVTSHQLGAAKEDQLFWQQLSTVVPHNRKNSLFIDDNHGVLDAARDFGIAHLLTVAQPDMQQPPQADNGYPAIEDFASLTRTIKRSDRS